jgi:hypothetical protein
LNAFAGVPEKAEGDVATFAKPAPKRPLAIVLMVEL